MPKATPARPRVRVSSGKMASLPSPISRAWAALTTPSIPVSIAAYSGCVVLFAVAFYAIYRGYELGWVLVLVSIWIFVFRAIVVRRDQP